MKVRKRFTGNLIGDDDYKQPEIKWCPHCMEAGFRERLGPRVLVGDEPRPPDYEMFLSCYACGRIVPVYEAQKESGIKNTIGTIENPFDQGHNIVGLGNVTKGRSKQTELSRKIKRMKAVADKEKDPDIKLELKRGNIVEKHYSFDE